MTTLTEDYEAKVAAGALRDDPAQRAVLPELERIRTALEAAEARRPRLLGGLFARAPDPIRGLYVWGPVGCGKSMLMDLFHGAVAIRDKRRVHFHAFMQEVQAALEVQRKAGRQDVIRPVADAIADEIRLLCFDEMQIPDIADAMIVGRLFARLFERGVTVVTTSNLAPSDLYKDGLNRQLFLPFIALIEERLLVVHLDAGRDYRLGRIGGGQVWFMPADAASRRAIDRIWTDLTGTDAAGERLVLRVQGRDVAVPQFRSGVARADFWDLCGRPLGPADYLALAGAVKVLILEDIPRLSAANYNEAKRFVTLIDALYEARVRLVASAADLPGRLYVEGEGSFEFERTASRLNEMQGADWGTDRGA